MRPWTASSAAARLRAESRARPTVAAANAADRSVGARRAVELPTVRAGVGVGPGHAAGFKPLAGATLESL